jgi:hypothetical protein
MLEQDVVEFYAMLEADGFIVSGETLEYLDRKDVRLLYGLFIDYSRPGILRLMLYL